MKSQLPGLRKTTLSFALLLVIMLVFIQNGRGQTYCTSGGTTYSQEWIGGINLGGFTKTSSAAGYSDFTSNVINLTAGTTNNITLTPGFASTAYNEFWRVWIDFNGDKDFDDPGEELLSKQSTGIATGTITLPATIVNTRMRIAMKGSHFLDRTNEGGTVSAQYNDNPANEGIASLVDNTSSTKYNVNHEPIWVQYRFAGGKKYVVTKYTITSANDEPDRDPKSWTLQGSNNGTSWTTLDTKSGIDFPNRFQTLEFTFTNATAYEYYQLSNISNSVTGTFSTHWTQFSEWELFAYDDSYPTTCGTFAFGEVEDYTVNIQPACTNASLALSSAAGTNAQTVCLNSPISDITYTVGGGATGATISGQPTGISGNFSGGTFTISGTPAVSGPFTYTVTTTGTTAPCNETSSIGTININSPIASITGKTDITCNGANDGTITISASGGTPPYAYSVDNGATWKEGSNPYIYNGLKANTPYQIRVKDHNECRSITIP